MSTRGASCRRATVVFLVFELLIRHVPGSGSWTSSSHAGTSASVRDTEVIDVACRRAEAAIDRRPLRSGPRRTAGTPSRQARRRRPRVLGRSHRFGLEQPFLQLAEHALLDGRPILNQRLIGQQIAAGVRTVAERRRQIQPDAEHDRHAEPDNVHQFVADREPFDLRLAERGVAAAADAMATRPRRAGAPAG